MSHSITNALNLLCRLYPSHQDVKEIAQRTGISPGMIPYASRLLTYWHNVINESFNHGLQKQLIDNIVQDFPANVELKNALNVGVTKSQYELKPREDFIWKGKSIDELEKITGTQSSLVPISFLTEGLKRSKSVCKIYHKNNAIASGFITKNDILVTNNHVIQNQTICSQIRVEFSDEVNMEYDIFSLNSDQIFETDAELDYTLVKVIGNPSNRWGYIALDQFQDLEIGDKVNIIQFPGGGQKKMSYYHNNIAFIDDRTVQYLTDTLPGSSGSPVFDKDWNLVAVHHSGGWITDPGSNERVFRNQGTPISKILTSSTLESEIV